MPHVKVSEDMNIPMRVSVYVYMYLMQKRGIADRDVGLPHSIHGVSCQGLRL